MPPSSRGPTSNGVAPRSPSPDLLDALVPTAAWLLRVFQSPALNDSMKSSILTNALLRASSSGDSDVLEFLLQRSSQLTSLVDCNGRDVDGVPAIVLATSLRHGDCVRILVEAGADVDATDGAGWSALHWATQGSDFPLAAYLLNHRATMDTRTVKGLRPVDLVKIGRDGDAMREILSYAEERHQAEAVVDGKVKQRERKTSWKTKGKARAVDEEARKRFELARDCVAHLDLDLGQLGMRDQAPHAGPSHRKRRSSSSASALAAKEQEVEFDWDECQLDQMMIFSEHDLPALFAVVIDEAEIVPDSHTAADVLFLAARYAALMGPDSLLDDLLLGAMERIEAIVHGKPENMALLAFWLSNALTMLHYLRRDGQLDPITSALPPVEPDEDEVPSLQVQLTDLVNELFVFVIRDIEKRIDAVLEPAMLDYESLPFDDVHFEGEWRLAKAFNSIGRSSRQSMGASSVMALFGAESPSPSAMERAARRGQSMTNLRTPPSPSPTSHSPRTISALLSSLVFVLQRYRLPSYLILQALAQTIYWISCELFNRIISRRKHLCRSRAVQIRLNASSLEDWARLNGLPTALIARPFEPLNALLQWLQCLSSERRLDDLLRTLRNLRALNPLQLRRAVREYRYEVEEPRMGDECAQYLAQMQLDWERGRSVDPDASFDSSAAGDVSGSTDGGVAAAAAALEVTRHLDEVFAVEGTGVMAYEAPEVPTCLGELLDSRHMLPFALPSNRDLLLPHTGPDNFGPLASLAYPRVTPPPQLVTPTLPDGLLARLDATAARVSAARAVYAHNTGRAASGLGLGLESPSVDHHSNAVNGWREQVEIERGVR